VLSVGIDFLAYWGETRWQVNGRLSYRWLGTRHSRLLPALPFGDRYWDPAGTATGRDCGEYLPA